MKSIKTFSKIILSGILFIFLFGNNINLALADDNTGKFDSIISSNGSATVRRDIAGVAGLSNTPVPTMIGNIIKIILGLSGTIALIFIIWGGIKWMISKGDTNKIQEARKLMTSGIIGIAIIAAAYAITDFVISQISIIAA